MKKIQSYIIGLIICLSIFLNIERLDYVEDNIINISNFVYVLGILSSIAIIAFRPVWRLRTFVIATLGTYLFLKLVIFTKQPLIGGVQSYVSFAEIILLCGLIVVAQRVSRSLRHFEKVLETLTVPQGSPRVPSLDEAIEDLKAEMHLSRRHERSLSVVVVDYKSDPVQKILDRVYDDLKSLMAKRYAANCFSRMLNGAIRRTDRLIEVRGHRHNRFIVLCHEANQEGLNNLLRRIQSEAAAELGISVACGTASFPEEALTFEELLEKAESRAAKQLEPASEKPVEPLATDID